MSKKSRKRNKKILAAIGIGLGAAALASRKKKSDLASTEDGKSGSTKITGGKNLNDYITKKDTATKEKAKKNIPQTTKVNTSGKDIPGIKVKAKDGKVNYIKASTFDKTSPNKEFKGPDARYDYKNRAAKKNTAGIAEPKKYALSAANLFPRSKAANEFKASRQDYNRSNQNPEYKSGGRAGLKSGGSVKKSMGKALRGGGKVIR